MSHNRPALSSFASPSKIPLTNQWVRKGSIFDRVSNPLKTLQNFLQEILTV